MDRADSALRPRFEDDRSGARADSTAGPRVWEVAALVHAVSDALAARFGAVAVRGEVSGYARAASGHCYFVLKDAQGAVALRCAMFRRAAALLDFTPEEGDLVELRGRLAVYEPRGELQFVVEAMRRAGAGALYERFLRLKAQLEAEGLFEAARKRPVATHPRGIGIVTSLQAAALHDVLAALQRRAPHVALVIVPSAVQGAEAPASLAAAIATAGRCGVIDTLLVCRGGGSLEDLWAFNEAAVVRAIAASPVPVIVGVGHETDVTLADFAADLRAPTPTAAAELAALTGEEAWGELQTWHARARRTVGQRVDAQSQRLDRAALRLARPVFALAPHRQRLALLEARLRALPSRDMERRRRQAEGLVVRLIRAQQRGRERGERQADLLGARLQALDPKRVLARGYAWLTDPGGKPLVSVAQIQAGATLQAQLIDGRVRARVAAVEADPADPRAAPNS